MNDRYSEVDLILTHVFLIPVSFNGALYIKWCQLRKLDVTTSFLPTTFCEHTLVELRLSNYLQFMPNPNSKNVRG